MMREKSPGLKILWVWTLGTAAIVMTSFVRTRLRDLETQIKSDGEQQQTGFGTEETVIIDDGDGAHES
ncbi:hypothetical protein Scep_029168 [Stephania cephalantha]|uniref:Uncharacterized protein n=1 Tax=Stephania cephalantha TaxID=152367 RepID=A0AAP0E1L2_9MAGN